ncbi:Uncharacterised protein [Vibrio cholerae]|nr:Uncharacterised protein [Vibrio cholerae]
MAIRWGADWRIKLRLVCWPLWQEIHLDHDYCTQRRCNHSEHDVY